MKKLDDKTRKKYAEVRERGAWKMRLVWLTGKKKVVNLSRSLLLYGRWKMMVGGGGNNHSDTAFIISIVLKIVSSFGRRSGRSPTYSWEASA